MPWRFHHPPSPPPYQQTLTNTSLEDTSPSFLCMFPRQDTRMSLMRVDINVSSFNHMSFKAGVVNTCRCSWDMVPGVIGLGNLDRRHWLDNHTDLWFTQVQPCSQWPHHAWEGWSRPPKEQLARKLNLDEDYHARMCHGTLTWSTTINTVNIKTLHLIIGVFDSGPINTRRLAHNDLHLRQPQSSLNLLWFPWRDQDYGVIWRYMKCILETLGGTNFIGAIGAESPHEQGLALGRVDVQKTDRQATHIPQHLLKRNAHECSQCVLLANEQQWNFCQAIWMKTHENTNSICQLGSILLGMA